MSAAELDKWMKKYNVTAVDIASALKMHPTTIDKFLKGAPVRRSTIAAFERFMESYSPKSRRIYGT